MSDSLPLSPAARGPQRLAYAAIAVTAAVASAVWIGQGVMSLPGLALLGAALVAGAITVAALAPELLAIAAPALMPLPLVWIVFPYEMAFYPLAFLLLLHALVRRPPWLFRLESLEIANLLFIGWAFFTGLWVADVPSYLLGVRKLGEGAIALWVSYRLARRMPRRVFETGLVANALALSLAALLKRNTVEAHENILRVNRASATDLGWGTANAIATLLLLLSPLLLLYCVRSRDRWMRWGAWPALALTGLMQVIIASRAATVLFAAGLLVQTGSGWMRRRWAIMTATLAAFAGLLMTPFGTAFLERFTSPRELGSIAVRVWYFREAWRRTLDNLPWGIGLHQGLTYPDHLQNIDPHDYWLAISSEMGIPGVLLWLVVLVFLWRRLRRIAATPGWEATGFALQLSFWLSQLHTLVEPTFQGPQYQFLYFWVMGGYLGYHAASVERAQRAPAASSE